MHNDVKQFFRSFNVQSGSCSHERIQSGVVFHQSKKIKIKFW